MRLRWQATDAICPGCGKPATRVRAMNWLFRCDMCAWDYGHPQFMRREYARQALAAARLLARSPSARKAELMTTTRGSSIDKQSAPM